ncbi:MAG: ATP-binding cassette domain-containing protein [Micromonosporaceae bacterium]|nr:ATP-binding cassette domain-containing protein [Micromonosporaceae bacterium]
MRRQTPASRPTPTWQRIRKPRRTGRRRRRTGGAVSPARSSETRIGSPGTLEVRDLVAGYGQIEALHGVSLHVEGGEAVALVGANGAGKTTLLSAIAGLVPARRGAILLDGQDITRWPTERRVRHGVALVPEGRRVFAGLTVEENLMLGAYARRGRDVASRKTQVLDLFPKLAARRRQHAGTLSGGEQQMLAIGRALMGAPRVLLLDEPSLGLAPLAVAEVVAALAKLVERGVTILLVEQNAHAAFEVAKRGYLLDRGEVAVAGTTEELADDPKVQAAYLGGVG